MNKHALSSKIKNIRIERKETLEEFAEQIRKQTDFKIKTTKSNVSKWEKGLNVPNDIALKAIADLGGVNVSSLLKTDLLEYIDIKSKSTNKTFSELIDILHTGDFPLSVREKQLVLDIFTFISYKNFSEVDDLQKDKAIDFVNEALELINYALDSKQPSVEENQKLIDVLYSSLKELDFIYNTD